MDAPENSLKNPQSGATRNDLAGLLGPGVMTLAPRGDVRFADTRALELLGCADGFELERLWERLRGRLEGAGLSWNGAGGSQDQRVALDLAVEEGATGGAPHRLLFDLRREPESGGVLLVHSLETLSGLESDLRLTSQMRSVSQISPAVAHDLRAPINAMVFNIEILKEMLASGRATDPANKDKLLRYVNVLKEELSRLHRGLENFLAYISPRGDRDETLDLRELAEELAALLVAPARKQQAQVRVRAAGGAGAGGRQPLPAAAGAPPPRPRRPDRRAEAGGAPPAARRARTAAPGCACTAWPGATARRRRTRRRPPAAPGFDLSFSAGGALAQLWVARADSCRVRRRSAGHRSGRGEEDRGSRGYMR